jgi:hypothetical protein
VPLSTVDLKRASDPLAFNGHGSGARVPSDSFIRRTPMPNNHTSSTTASSTNGISSGPLGLAALRNKKPPLPSTTTTTSGSSVSLTASARQRMSM